MSPEQTKDSHHVDHRTVVRPGRLKNFHRYETHGEVELDGEQATINVELDGKPYLRWHGRSDSLAAHSNSTLPQSHLLAVGTYRSPITVHELKLRPLDEEDFVENIDGLVQTDPDRQWRFVTDNLNTHCSESLVVYVAQQCGIDTDLGVKGRCGVVKSMPSRREFLCDPSHRLRFI